MTAGLDLDDDFTIISLALVHGEIELEVGAGAVGR